MAKWTSIQLDEAIENSRISRFHYMLLAICGLNFMVDAMEISLLPFLVNCVAVEWDLSPAQKASIGSAVYAGCLIGCFVWGAIGDRYGRRWTYLAAASLIAIAGFASAAASSYEGLLLIRTVVGFGIGGAHVPFDLLAEFTPHKFHSTFLTSVEYFYTFGSVFVSLLAWLLLESYGWRSLAALTAVPITVATIGSIFILPESPRWLFIKGRVDEAMQIIHNQLDIPFHHANAYEENILSNQPPPSLIKPVSCHNISTHGNGPQELNEVVDGSIYSYFAALFEDKVLRFKTFLLWIIWFSFGITYYGVILYVANIYSFQHQENNISICSFNYSSIFLNALSEFFGTTLAVTAAARWNHVRAQMIFYVFAGIFAIVLGILHGADSLLHSSLTSVLLLIFSFFARISVMSASTLTWTMTPSMIPTQYRSFGHAFCVALSKIGAIASPYLIYISAGGSSKTSRIFSDLVVAVILGFVNFLAGTSLYYISKYREYDDNDIHLSPSSDDSPSSANIATTSMNQQSHSAVTYNSLLSEQLRQTNSSRHIRYTSVKYGEYELISKDSRDHVLENK